MRKSIFNFETLFHRGPVTSKFSELLHRRSPLRAIDAAVPDTSFLYEFNRKYLDHWQRWNIRSQKSTKKWPRLPVSTTSLQA